MIKWLLWRAAHFVLSIIPEADVGVRGVDHEDLPVVDGDRLAAYAQKILLPTILANIVVSYLIQPHNCINVFSQWFCTS